MPLKWNILLEDALKAARRILFSLSRTSPYNSPDIDPAALLYEVEATYPIGTSQKPKGQLFRIRLRPEHTNGQDNKNCTDAYLFKPYKRHGIQLPCIFTFCHKCPPRKDLKTHQILVIEGQIPDLLEEDGTDLLPDFQGFYDLVGNQPHPKRFATPIIFQLAKQVAEQWGETAVDIEFLVDSLRLQIMGAWYTGNTKREAKVIHVREYDPGTKGGIIRLRGDED